MAFNSSIIVPNTERNSAQSIETPISELVVPDSDECDMEKEPSVPVLKPQSSTSSLRKRSYAIAVDSSDDEKETAASKRAKPLLAEKANSKAKNVILLDSPDEEESVKPKTTAPVQKQHMTRRSKAVDEAKAVQPPVPVAGPNRHMPKTGKRVYCVDSSDEDNNNSQEPKKSSAVDAPSAARKKPEAVAATRISPRLNAKSVATNITNQPPEKLPMPPKRAVLSVAVDDEDDEGGLFQFRKTPQKTAVTTAQPKSADKGKISVINFLEKSQSHSASHSESQSQTQPRKRLRLEPLNESDSDDCENLFNFADSKKKKKNQEENNEDSTDGLFNFNSEIANESADQDSVLTEPFQPEVGTKNCRLL